MLKVTERASNEALEAHRPGYAVFDVGSYSLFVRDRLVDWLFVLAVLIATALSLYLLARGLEYAARSLLEYGTDRLGLAAAVLVSGRPLDQRFVGRR